MNHGYFQDRLSAYFDQSLTPEEMRAIKEHLADCTECRKQLDDLAKLDRLIEEKRDLGEFDYWEKAAQKIEQRIGSLEDDKVTDVRSSWFGLGWKLAATAASLAVLTFIALHEGEIQDSAVRKDEASKVVMVPKIDFAGRTETDTGLIGKRDEIDPHGKAMEIDLQSTGETSLQTMSRPETKKAAPTVVPAESDVSKELEGKAAAEAAWQDEEGERIVSEKPDLHTQPVTSVDELLESVAGVVTNADGEILISEGRAGEAAYVVDSLPADDTEEVVVDLGTTALVRKPSDLGTTISVTAERDVIDKFEVSNQTAITKEQLATTNDTRSLDDYRTVRDSLQPLIVAPSETRSFSGIKSKGAEEYQDIALNVPSPPAADSIKPPTPTPLERYLEACYKIAELTDRESEYDSAVAFIENHAENSNSPVQDLARQYLDLIDALQE